MARTTALVSLLLLFTGTVFAQDDADETVVSPDDATAGEALAFDREGELCITTRAIRSTDIIDDRTILFEMRGGDYYVNNLTRTCRGLKREGSGSGRRPGIPGSHAAILDRLRRPPSSPSPPRGCRGR